MFSKAVLNACVCVVVALSIWIFLSGAQLIMATTPCSMSGIAPSIFVIGIRVAIVLVWMSLTMMSVAVIVLITNGLASNQKLMPRVSVMRNERMLIFFMWIYYIVVK